MHNLLVILEAGDVLPSGFIRGLIYKNYFSRHGLKARYLNRHFPPLIGFISYPPKILAPFFAYGVRQIFTLFEMLIVYFREIYIVHIAKQYSTVYMSKVMSFRLVRKLRQKTEARLVYDFGDALWLDKKAPRFNDILSLVDAVTTDNEYTAKYVKNINSNCFVIPDPPQVEDFDKMRSETLKGEKKTVVIGWIGTYSSVSNLHLILEPLERLFSKYPFLHLRLIGVGHNLKNLPPFRKVSFSTLPYYTQSEMIHEVLGMDIGIFPLYDTEAAIVRGILKATVYMSGEVAVVCSAIGQCVDLVLDGVNGMLAYSTDDWEKKLELLITDPELRRRIAKAGLNTARENFATEKCFLKLLSVLQGENK